ncbi:MAG: tRNA glutamyl-Q(34) synthetase GluQRS [Rhizobiaceae bacterium]|nr:tRNA glutamyl-Q(34) synthetase GluQRS [Rhizobiaceae bacterium]
MASPVFRFAPSPNGELHLGHAFSAILNADLAARMGGRFLLRIEDIDTARCRPEFEAAIYRDLAWLGLAWEEPVRRQSDHFADYAALLDRLVRDDLVYPSFMSRGEIREHISEAESKGRRWPRDPDGVPLYPGVEKTWSKRARRKKIEGGEPFSWRLDVAAALARAGKPPSWREADGEDFASVSTVDEGAAAWGDVVVARKETPTSYHLSVVADDALQGVTHVVRGRDLFHATSVQRLLQVLLGLPEPAYLHHRLITGTDERKLSKSRGAPTLRSLREAGATPTDVRDMVGLAPAEAG